jgi:hypothetical protein
MRTSRSENFVLALDEIGFGHPCSNGCLSHGRKFDKTVLPTSDIDIFKMTADISVSVTHLEDVITPHRVSNFTDPQCK